MNLLLTRWLLALLSCALAPLGALAGPYTDLIVFGDSLSDVGNTFSSSIASLFIDTDDYMGRFSNGPVYAERLSMGLDLGTLTRDGVGGDNFAYGGAETNGPGGLEGWFINSLSEQVTRYLNRIDGATPDPQTLFVVFIGANDFLRADETNPATPAGVVQTQINRLINAGARQLLGVNLPLLGLTPDYSANPSEAATKSSLAATYNDALENVYSTLETTNPAVTIHRLDVESLFSSYLDNAASLGFTNTVDRGQDVPGSSYDRAPGYVFWDGVHPTREAHALLGEAAIRAVLPEGDYNRDGMLNAADYDAWRAAYGTTFNAFAGQTPSLAADGNGDGRVDAADYTLWRDLMSAAAVAVPEPAGVWLVVAALATGWRLR